MSNPCLWLPFSFLWILKGGFIAASQILILDSSSYPWSFWIRHFRCIKFLPWYLCWCLITETLQTQRGLLPMLYLQGLENTQRGGWEDSSGCPTPLNASSEWSLISLYPQLKLVQDPVSLWFPHRGQAHFWAGYILDKAVTNPIQTLLSVFFQTQASDFHKCYSKCSHRPCHLQGYRHRNWDKCFETL